MSNKVWLIIATIAVLVAEAAVGTLISPEVALWLLVIVVPLGAFAYWRVFKTKVITSSEVRDFQYRINQRKKYLPQLKRALDELIDRQYELADEAGKLSLFEYRDRYLKRSFKYKLMTDSPVSKLINKMIKDEKMVILTALKYENLIKNNPYVLELEARDDYKRLWRRYSKWYSVTYEKPLRGIISRLLKLARQSSSISAIAQVARREFTRNPKNLINIYKNEARLRALVEYSRKLVNDEFRELLEDGKPN